MFKRIIKVFVKDSDNLKSAEVRQAYGRFAGITGIVCNVFLFVIKIVAGFLFGSISVIADAVNNLSDALSSVITTICLKISNKPADEDHPYGHQRMEYIAALIVSFIILFIGYELICSSVNEILNPKDTVFSMLTVAVLLVSIAVKLFMNRMFNFTSKAIGSQVLKANAQDSINDVISTTAVLFSVVISALTPLSLDGFMGLAVSVFIIISGVSLIKETLDPLLGTVPDKEFVKNIETKILSYDGIIGIHDLMVHNYGPDMFYASVHAEVPANEDVLTSHDIIDNIERDFLNEDNINLIIHMDPIVTDDENVTELKNKIADILSDISHKFTFHDFRVVFGHTHTNLIFDVVVPYGFKHSEEKLNSMIQNEVHKTIGENFYCVIAFDKKFIRD